MTAPAKDWPACTKEEPLHLSLLAVGYLFAIADDASKLLDAILNQKPIAEYARKLTVSLHEVDNHIERGLFIDDAYWCYAEALLEVRLPNVVVDSSDQDDVVLSLWQDPISHDAEAKEEELCHPK